MTNVQRLNRRFCSLILAFSLCFHAMLSNAAGTVSATLDRTVIASDETVTLTIETSQTDAPDQPDLEPLSTQFDILGVSRSNRIQIINGRTDAAKSWIINLAPKQEGTLTIPSLRIGRERTEAISLQVEPAGQATGNTNASSSGARDDVFLEMTADITDPYVQQQVIVTQRLFYRVPLREGALSKLESDGALIERLGDDKEFEKDRNGQRYRVIERRYAVFPQRSGRLVLNGAQLSAQIPDQRNSNSGLNRFFGRDVFDDPFGMMQSMRPITRKSENITLEVKAQPASATNGVWLPARQIKLQEEWSADTLQLNTGQPITRTVRLIAEGLAANQLPPLPTPELSFAKVYPDKSNSSNVTQANGLTATVEQKLALIPQQGGYFTLPEIRIPWWNVVTRQQEVARLPARKVHVHADAAGTSSTVSTPQSITPSTELNIPTFEPLNQPAAQVDEDASKWRFLTVALTLAWALTTWLWLRERGRRGPVQPDSTNAKRDSDTASTRAAINQIKAACQNNDAHSAAQALLNWGSSVWPDNPPRSLPALAQRLDEAENNESIQALHNLDRLLYSGAGGSWDGKSAAAALSSGLKVPKKAITSQEVLPPLYPA